MIDYSLLYNFELLAGRGRVVLNCTREALTTGLVTLLSARSTVLEILEDIEPDDEVVEACRKLHSMGYQISLDDYVPDQAKERLLPYADYIKIDFRLCDAGQRTAILRDLKNHPSVLIAEKVENRDEFAVAMDEGFELFQGYFFSRPTMFSRSSATPSRSLYLRLRAALSQFPFDWDEVECIVREDASLCYRLFRLVDHGDHSVSQPISSLHKALVKVGEDRFRKLVTIAMTAEVQRGSARRNRVVDAPTCESC